MHNIVMLIIYCINLLGIEEVEILQVGFLLTCIYQDHTNTVLQ